jgi:hypothetical protein
MTMSNGWEAWIKEDPNDFARNTIQLILIRRFPDFVEYITDWSTMSKYQEMSDGQEHPDAPGPKSILLPRDAVSVIADAFMSHAGVYAGADYQRLRTDYDRIAKELETANTFIRETLQTLLTKRAAYTNKNEGDAQ